MPVSNKVLEAIDNEVAEIIAEGLTPLQFDDEVLSHGAAMEMLIADGCTHDEADAILAALTKADLHVRSH